MKFTHTLLALAIASSAAIAPSAFAQSADLSVTGKIFPGACVIDIGNGGIADLGDIRLDALQADAATQLDDIDLAMSVSCQSPVRFALQGVDNTSDTSIAPAQYGLGLTPADEKIGSARLNMAGVTIDGAAAHILLSSDGGQSWTIGLLPDSSQIGKQHLLGFNTERNGEAGPSPIENLQATLKVKATIAPTNDLTVLDEVPINGNATINLFYL